MKKIIFLDVDGTIVDYDNHIPDSAKIAIQQSRKKWTLSIPLHWTK
ncbi:HAD superfamily hydrolase [Streptococcus pneumoniae]|uniref:HAD superfamily hydrolase n=1 Tax=Streptococcus pneumoniae TaxID=1313 RepID=A0A4J2F4I9_STREE|nr:Hydrolase, HAD superfamily, putative [Streptococcus pneumoniae SP19-BS75]VFH97534.1 HAD superfamily hydrolase [Streptococcus pneumoniae]VIU87452.1 HAD superfamily hydrolase [Streptococcus pneumoniae]VIZ58743.1 HAD superfamily hydrolase [Streptococcus pneumoniae]VJG11181.1 HAD superfamily hydrolase [Streptococcus pneumoniae]